MILFFTENNIYNVCVFMSIFRHVQTQLGHGSLKKKKKICQVKIWNLYNTCFKDLSGQKKSPF